MRAALIVCLAFGATISGGTVAAQAVLAPPVLHPDSVAALADRAARAGLLTDSLASLVADCAADGVPTTRATLLDAVTRSRGVGIFPSQMVIAGGEPAERPRLVWLDSLAASGLLTPSDVRAVRPLMELVFRELPDGLPQPSAARTELRLLSGLTHRRVTLDPSWLAADAELWIEGGLMTPSGRDRLLADARAGRLVTPQDVVPYLDAVDVTDVEHTGNVGAATREVSEVLGLIRSGTRLLRRRGVADLRVEGLTVDTVEVTAHGADVDDWGRDPRPVAVVSATVDGERYEQELGYQPSLTILNRVLRDRRSVYRVAVAGVGMPPDSVRTAILVLTPAQRALLSASSLRAVSAPRRAVVRAASEVRRRRDRCRDLASQASRSASLEVRLQGATSTPREGRLTRDGVAYAWDRLAAVGLLDHVGADTLDAVRRTLSRRFLREPRDLIDAVPGLIVRFFGDDATYDDPEPYGSMIRRFARASRGVFAPQDVVDTFSFEADSARVGFTMGGRSYQTTVEVGSWLYASFVPLIAQAMAGSEVRLYRLGRSTENGFAFLTRAQFAELAVLGLLGDGSGLVAPDDVY